MNVYLYTDIDIFKTRHHLFFFLVFVLRWRQIKRKWLWESFGDLVKWTWWEAVSTPKPGTGAKGRITTALMSPSYLNNEISAMGKDSWTNEHVWHREDRLSIQLNLQWPQLPPPHPRLFVSQALPLVLLFDGRLPHWGTWWTEMLAYFLPIHVVATTCLISLYLSLVDM